MAIGAGVAALIGGFLGFWKRNYNAGRAEPEESYGRHVILEQAELRDFGQLPKQLADLGAKLDRAISHDEMARPAREEMLKILRRMEGEIDLAKRMREEKILRMGKRDTNGNGE